MSKKVVLVGHCGPDSSYLRMAVTKAVRDTRVTMADDETRLERELLNGADLLLLNRQLDWGFKTDEGVELIRQLRDKHPDVKTMLVTNYEEVQREAIAAGALPGFGKREIGTPRVTEILKNALGE